MAAAAKAAGTAAPKKALVVAVFFPQLVACCSYYHAQPAPTSPTPRQASSAEYRWNLCQPSWFLSSPTLCPGAHRRARLTRLLRLPRPRQRSSPQWKRYASPTCPSQRLTPLCARRVTGVAAVVIAGPANASGGEERHQRGNGQGLRAQGRGVGLVPGERFPLLCLAWQALSAKPHALVAREVPSVKTQAAAEPSRVKGIDQRRFERSLPRASPRANARSNPRSTRDRTRSRHPLECTTADQT